MKNSVPDRTHFETSQGNRMAVVLLLLAGCAEQAPPQTPSTPVTDSAMSSPEAVRAADRTGDDSADIDKSTSVADNSFDFKPLTLNNLPQASVSESGGAKSGISVDPEQQIQTIIARLQPLQVLLGQWRGTTRREYENFKAVDNHEWVWDLRTKKDRPALTIKSDKSPYLKTGSLSWDTSRDMFSLVAVDASGATRQFSGDFTEPVHEIVGSDEWFSKKLPALTGGMYGAVIGVSRLL